MKFCRYCLASVDDASKMCLDCGRFCDPNPIQTAVLSSSARELTVIDDTRFYNESEVVNSLGKLLIGMGLISFAGGLFFLVQHLVNHGGLTKDPQVVGTAAMLGKIAFAGILLVTGGFGIVKRRRWGFFLGILLALMAGLAILSYHTPAPLAKAAAIDHAHNISTVFQGLLVLCGMQDVAPVPYVVALVVNLVFSFVTLLVLFVPKHAKEFF